MEIETRWMKKDDVPAAIRIMRSCGVEITEKQFDRLVAKPSTVCIVAESDDAVSGVMVYDVGRVSKVKIVHLCVEAPFRRKGVGSSLMSLVTSKLNSKRNKAEAVVSEYNLEAQLFLKSAGFRAVSTLDRSPEPSEYKFVLKPERDSGG